MNNLRLSLFICGFIFAVGRADAADRSILAPERFVPPPTMLTPLRQQDLFTYRNQIESQLRRLERAEALGRLDPLDRPLLRDTRVEAMRLDGLLAPMPVAPGLPAADRPLLPSLAD